MPLTRSVLTLETICDAIAAEFAAVTSLVRVQSPDDLTEGMHDTPTLAVYPVSVTRNPDQFTLRQAVRRTQITARADVFVAPRANIDEDIVDVVDVTDAIIAELDAQREPPYFHCAGIRSLNWRWELVTFDYAGGKYSGGRFTLDMEVY